MKTIFTLSLVFVVITTLMAQNVSIPDAAFKSALIAAGVDSNNDTEISEAEAEATSVIYIENKGISDLTGIQAFTNLVNLKCEENSLTTIDVSNLVLLERFMCWGNQLTTLNIENTPKLKYFSCAENNLTVVDVSENTKLSEVNIKNNNIVVFDVAASRGIKTFECQGNALTSLNVSDKPVMTSLDCSDNPILKLNISTSTYLVTLHMNDMPYLTEVCISSSVSWPYSNLSDLQTTNSPAINYTTTCSPPDASAINDNDVEDGVQIFPNPADSYIAVEHKFKDASVELFSVDGSVVYTNTSSNNSININVANYATGIYFLKLTSGKQTIVKKVIKN